MARGCPWINVGDGCSVTTKPLALVDTGHSQGKVAIKWIGMVFSIHGFWKEAVLYWQWITLPANQLGPKCNMRVYQCVPCGGITLQACLRNSCSDPNFSLTVTARSTYNSHLYSKYKKKTIKWCAFRIIPLKFWLSTPRKYWKMQIYSLEKQQSRFLR